MPSKGGSSGRKAVVKSSPNVHWAVSLPAVLDREREYFEQRSVVGVPEIDNVGRNWFRIYHALVWLVAATNENCYPVSLPFYGAVGCNCPENPYTMGEDYCIEEGHLVPAFSPEESGCEEGDPRCTEIDFAPPVSQADINSNVGNEVRRGWIFRDLMNTFHRNHSENFLDTLEINFPDFIYQQVGNKTLLQRFLSKFRLLPSDFNLRDCLSNCRTSRSETGFAENSNEFFYIGEALDLIEALWDDQNLENHLEMMNYWDVTLTSEPIGSKAWLNTELGLNSLTERMAVLFAGNNSEARRQVSKWKVRLDLNMFTFSHIFNRLRSSSDIITMTDGSQIIVAHGLESAIDNLPLITVAQQANWDNLLYATYGAVAHQIFQQAQSVSGSVRDILDEAGI